jgi:hypothetical protein
LFGLSRGSSAVIYLLAAVYVGVSVYGFREHWGADQWGDLATWIAGVSTTGAVVVALWQAKLARDDARQVRLEAQEEIARVNQRFERELQAADERLARELDASRRMEQLRTIPPIWESIGGLGVPYVDFKEALEDGVHMPNTDEAVGAFMAKTKVWIAALTRLELVFTPAMMLVSEPNTQAAVTQLYEQTRKLLQLSEDAAEDCLRYRQRTDFTTMNELLKEINLSRRSMTGIVRQHLTQVPPLEPSS